MDIASWLHSLGLQQYEAAFRDNAIDAAVLSELTADDLKDLGVTLVGHRRRLLAAIAALRTEAGAISERATPVATVGGSPFPNPPPRVGEGRVGVNAERRQLTVMFCDLVGSTPLSARRDPAAEVSGREIQLA